MTNLKIPDDALARFRQAATRYTPGATPSATRLHSAKDDIATLRAKGASYRTISQLLRRCDIVASDQCVRRFCRRELGEKPRRDSKRKPSTNPNRAPKAMSSAASDANTGASPNATPGATALDDLLSRSHKTINPPNDDGPRIARIEFA